MGNKKMIILFNLVIGFYNLYLYSVGDKFFNLIIGALNIGVWAFFRRIDE